MAKTVFFKKNLIFSMIIGVLVALFGVFVMLQGDTFISIFLLLFGFASIVKGIKELIFLNNYTGHKSTQSVSIISSIISILIGVFVIYFHNESVEFVKSFVLYLLAAQLIISSISDLFVFSVLIKNKEIGASSRVIAALIKIVISLIFIFFPNQVVSFVFKLVGAVFVLYGLYLFFWSFFIRKTEKSFDSKTVESEAEIIDEDK